MEHTYRLVISCPDRVGIVAKVSNFLSTYNGWITEASHHSDTQAGWFFMRHEIKAESIPFGLDQFRAAFEPIAREFNMNWHIADSARPKRVILMCSKESHCLADLLHRWHSKELNCEIVAVISNHDDLRRMVEWHDIPYHHVPVSKENKEEAFAHIDELFQKYEADVVVLNPAATEAMALRAEAAQSLSEELFILQIMGDDRAVEAVYVAGRAQTTSVAGLVTA